MLQYTSVKASIEETATRIVAKINMVSMETATSNAAIVLKTCRKAW